MTKVTCKQPVLHIAAGTCQPTTLQNAQAKRQTFASRPHLVPQKACHEEQHEEREQQQREAHAMALHEPHVEQLTAARFKDRPGLTCIWATAADLG
jgi:hypothetical protein